MMPIMITNRGERPSGHLLAPTETLQILEEHWKTKNENTEENYQIPVLAATQAHSEIERQKGSAMISILLHEQQLITIYLDSLENYSN